MYELLSSAMLGTTIHDVKMKILARIDGLSAKLTKKGGKAARNQLNGTCISRSMLPLEDRMAELQLTAIFKIYFCERHLWQAHPFL